MALWKSTAMVTVVSIASIGACAAQSFGFANFSAEVNANGSTQRSLGVQNSTRSSTGIYVINFTRDVDGCFIVAGPHGAIGGQASVQSVATDPRRIRVYTFSRTGQPANRAFVVLVNCAS
jgi:hypothetical protein